jgi:hypothetical protein
MSLIGDFVEGVGDLVSTAADIVEAVAPLASPFGLAATALTGGADVLDKLTGSDSHGASKSIWKNCTPGQGSSCGGGSSGGNGSGSLSIEPGDSLATILAKVFGAQLNEKEDKVRSLATQGTGGEDASSRNALIGAAVADLTNLSSIAGKTIDAVKDAQNSALGT